MRRLLLLRGVVSLVTFHVIYCANITLKVNQLFSWLPENDPRRATYTRTESWRYIHNGTALMNIEGQRLELTCTADVPIKWKWTEDGVSTVL
jgi:hypothetical protein